MNRQSSRRRAERAASLKSIGRTWQEIADTLGYRSRQAAQQAVERLGNQTPPVNAEALRRQEAEELRIRRAVLHERFHAARKHGDDETLVMLKRELDRVSTRWSKLHGLDAADRSEIDVNVGQSATAVIDRMEAELLALAQSNTNIIEAEVVE